LAATSSTVATHQNGTEHHFARKRLRWVDLKEHLTGYLFILPAVLIITLFGIFPIGYAFYMSLHQWRLGKKEQTFLGPDNYQRAVGDFGGLALFVLGVLLVVLAYILWTRSARQRQQWLLAMRIGAGLAVIAAGLVLSRGWGMMIATGDETFLHSLVITLYYSLGAVPLEIFLGMILAYILFQKIKGQEFFRMIYFLPYITPAVAAAVVFRSLFSSRETALINKLLGMFGLPAEKWLFEPRPFLQAFFGIEAQGFWAGPSMALVAIILFGVWTYVGYNTVIFLAGLGSIPRELYEAAEIDGANGFQLFRSITLPLLSPVTFYLALIAFIGTFKAFNHIYVMREAAAQGTVDVTSVLIFDTFYRRNLYGYAAAEAILLFLVILGLTIVQNKVFGEKVFYG
jgi:multiple sugar transport system permease protein